MDYAKIVADSEIKILELTKKIKSLNSQLKRNMNKRDAALVEMNKSNFNDMEWLIKNPTLPGSNEAMDAMMQSLYGGVWNGVHPSGYIHDGKYNPIQANFEFNCKIYSNDVDPETYKSNIRHFVENFLHFFDTYEVTRSRWNDDYPEAKVVGFQFMSRSRGLDYIGYAPANNKWYHYTTTYSNNDTKREFENFEDALDFIFTFVEMNDDD